MAPAEIVMSPAPHVTFKKVAFKLGEIQASSVTAALRFVSITVAFSPEMFKLNLKLLTGQFLIMEL